MLQSVMRGLVAERQQKVVLLIMAGAKKFRGFCHQLFVAGQVFVGDLDGGLAFTHHINHVERRFIRLAELHLAVNRSRNQRRIHQPRKRHRLEIRGAALLLAGRKRGAELPAVGQAN